VLETTTSATSHSVNGLAAQTSYAFTVEAFDAAGNASAQSSAVNVSTLAPPAGGGLVVDLTFSEGTGSSTTDHSGNGNDGAFFNGASWVTGQTGSGVRFDGGNDIVEIANSFTVDSPRGAITIIAWIYRETAQPGWRTGVLRQVGTGAFEHYLLGFLDNNFRWVVNTTSGYSSLTLGGPAPLQQWVHMVGTFDGATVRFYVNGVEQFSTPHTGTLRTDSTPITLGSSYNSAALVPGEALNGRIDGVKIFNRALTATEVQNEYLSTADLPPQVQITSPGSFQSVTGNILVSVNATDDVAVAGVQLKVNGQLYGVEDTIAPYQISLDTDSFPDGVHSLVAVARDSFGNLASSGALAIRFNNHNQIVPSQIMPLGDSITYGYVSDGHPDNDLGGYRRFLWESLVARQLSVDFVGSLLTGIPTIDRNHEGHPGWTILNIYDNVEPWLATYDPDTIMLILGTNDLISSLPAADALTRLSNLLDRIRTLSPNSFVFVSTVPGVVNGLQIGQMNEQKIRSFNSAIPGLVQGKFDNGMAVGFVDLYSLAGMSQAAGSPDFGPDGFHPSSSGYEKMSLLWEFALFGE
jgi:lysophospholipase L1-like esterase